jgi:glutathione S-transferase
MSDEPIVLGYWKIRGLAAACRMMCYYKKAPFVNRAYVGSEAAEWFGADKPELAKTNSLINLPYIKDGDNVITQSVSCLLYLGQKLGIDKAANFIRNHQAHDQAMDLRNDLIKVVYGGEKAEWQAKFEKHLEFAHFTKLEGFCAGPYMCGAEMQSADFHVFEMLDQHMAMTKECGINFDWGKFPKLVALHAAVKGEANLADYFGHEMYTRYAFNNPAYSHFVGSQYVALEPEPSMTELIAGGAADDVVDFANVLRAFVDAGISEMSDTKPADPYRKMYEFLFQASLVDYTTSPAAADKSKWDSDFVAKFGLPFHGDAVIALKGKGSGPKSGVRLMLADAGDFFSELSKKMKATGAPLTGAMTAEELKAADAAATKMKIEKLEKEQAERDAADAINAVRSAEMEASGKKVSGGLHKFDASEVDVNGGSATADDFMDAFGF